MKFIFDNPRAQIQTLIRNPPIITSLGLPKIDSVTNNTLEVFMKTLKTLVRAKTV